MGTTYPGDDETCGLLRSSAVSKESLFSRRQADQSRFSGGGKDRVSWLCARGNQRLARARSLTGGNTRVRNDAALLSKVAPPCDDASLTVLFGKLEVDRNLRLNFDRLAVEQIRLVLPLFDGIRGGLGQLRFSAQNFYMSDVAGF